MNETTGRAATEPVGVEFQEGVLRFPSLDDFRGQLDAIARQGVQRMLQAALEAELDVFLGEHRQFRDSGGHRLVARNGYPPPREVVTGSGPRGIRRVESP